MENPLRLFLKNMNPESLVPYFAFLEQVLTPERYQHSLGVMQMMENLASIYHLDREKAVLAGLLHDAAKDLPLTQQKQLQEEAGIQLEDPCEANYAIYLHGPVGAYYVNLKLGVTDPVILDAIRAHSFCGMENGGYSPLIWCLRFSDLLEPNRSLSDARWIEERAYFEKGRIRLEKAVFEGHLKEGALLQMGWIIRMFEEKGFPIHSNMRRIYTELSTQFRPNKAFWG